MNGGIGGDSYMATRSREQSLSTTLTTIAGIKGIVCESVGVTFEQSIADSSAYTFNTPPNLSGMLGLTSTLKCSTCKIRKTVVDKGPKTDAEVGIIVCDDGTSHGTTYTVYKW